MRQDMTKLNQFKESYPSWYHAMMLGFYEAVMMSGLATADAVSGTLLYYAIRLAVGIPGLFACWHCVMMIVSIGRYVLELSGVLSDNWKS